jgi:hypothetical protein
MKIVASITHSKFIVEMTDDEIAKLAGHSFHGASGFSHRLEPGAEIKVSESWDDLQKFRRAKEQITNAAETLKACAALALNASASYVIDPPEKIAE